MVGVGLAVAAIVAWLSGLLAVRIGPSLGFVDLPDGSSLKVHHRPAVPLGGVVVLVGTTVGWSVSGSVHWKVLGVATAVVVLGLLDDRLDLPPLLRLGAEIGLAALALSVDALPLGLDTLGEIIVGVGLIVVLVNAVNLFDGLDGLAGSTALVSLAGLTAVAIQRGLSPDLLVVAVGAVAGFLVLNRHPARLFLGDNGSYLLGFLIAVGIIGISPSGLGIELAISGLVAGVFLLDLGFTLIRRALGRRPLFGGDREHSYDRLHDRGWSISWIVGLAVIAQLGLAAVALTLGLA